MDREGSLLAGIRAGKPDWAAIYLAHRDAMYHAAHRALGRGRIPGGVQPDDVVSHVVRKLMNNGISPDVRNLEEYLVTAVINRVKDLRRQHSVWQKDGDAEDGKIAVLRESGLDEKGADGHTVAEGLRDGSMSVEDLVIESMEYERVLDNIYGLTPKEQHAVVERVFNGRPDQDIATELGVTPQRVSQLVKAGCQKLMRALGYSQEGRHVRHTSR